MNNLGKLVYFTFNVEIDVDEVEDDALNNSLHYQTHNNAIDEVSKDNDVLLEQKKFTKSTGQTFLNYFNGCIVHGVFKLIYEGVKLIY